MHKRVRDLTAGVHALYDDLYALMPKQYHENPNPSDPVSAAWRDAMSGMADGWDSLNTLSELLKAKAGIIVEKDELIEFDGESNTLAGWSAEYGTPEAVILDRVRDGMNWETAVTMPVDDRHETESFVDTPADDPPATATSGAAEE
jgi:hypothetical protein